jgi:2-keto-4-pentenoate hydratase/2-oxohepta-3-ene-1,7-dioic acid hydratase in catechol pathway
VVFMKPHTAINGPDQKIVKRPFVRELDYEGELTIVMGKTAKDVPESEAFNYVFGYTILNDVSARISSSRINSGPAGKVLTRLRPRDPASPQRTSCLTRAT